MKGQIDNSLDYVKRLAMLTEDNSDNTELVDEIKKVIEYFDILDEVDTSDTTPMYQFEEDRFFLREDIEEKYISIDSDRIHGVFFNDDGYVVVPKGEGV